MNNEMINAGYIRHVVSVMKQRFGEDTIALFHVAGSYECFLEDSILVSRVLNLPQESYLKENGTTVGVTRFPAGELANYRRILTSEGYATCTSETCDGNGTHILKIYESEQE